MAEGRRSKGPASGNNNGGAGSGTAHVDDVGLTGEITNLPHNNNNAQAIHGFDLTTQGLLIVNQLQPVTSDSKPKQAEEFVEGLEGFPSLYGGTNYYQIWIGSSTFGKCTDQIKDLTRECKKANKAWALYVAELKELLEDQRKK
eukprot:5947746-Lingulodinium_polyedra.AAC.1